MCLHVCIGVDESLAEVCVNKKKEERRERKEGRERAEELWFVFGSWQGRRTNIVWCGVENFFVFVLRIYAFWWLLRRAKMRAGRPGNRRLTLCDQMIWSI